MAVTHEQLLDMLNHLQPWRYEAGDWRMVKAGEKLVRFVAWADIAKKKAVAP